MAILILRLFPESTVTVTTFPAIVIMANFVLAPITVNAIVVNVLATRNGTVQVLLTNDSEIRSVFLYSFIKKLNIKTVDSRKYLTF